MTGLAKGCGLFLAGFALAAGVFLFQGSTPLARADMCVHQSATFKTRDQNIGDDRFAVRYAVPQCILDAGYSVSNTKFDNGHSFIIVYKKN